MIKMPNLRKLFENKDKKSWARLAAILVAGVLIILISRYSLPAAKTPANTNSPPTGPPPAAAEGAYARDLEKRMEDAFAQVAGVGRVKVLVTMAYGEETQLATDSKSNESTTKETDAQGGERTSTTKSLDQSVVTVTGAPVVLKTYTPKVQGVIIVAEGGDDANVRDRLTNAAMGILGLEANHVQVLTMKK